MPTDNPSVPSAGWTPLAEYPGETLYRGTVFRCHGAWPYEDLVDFMLLDDPHWEEGFTFIVASGYKAGRVVRKLPRSSATREPDRRGLSRSWLIENWQGEINEFGPDGVLVADNYDAPTDT